MISVTNKPFEFQALKQSNQLPLIRSLLAFLFRPRSFLAAVGNVQIDVVVVGAVDGDGDGDVDVDDHLAHDRMNDSYCPFEQLTNSNRHQSPNQRQRSY